MALGVPRPGPVDRGLQQAVGQQAEVTPVGGQRLVVGDDGGERRLLPEAFVALDDLGLAEPLLRAVREQGYDTPTPIQQQAIPAVIAGVVRSTIASALLSCRVTQAVRPSSETAMYSGSRSCATVAPGPSRAGRMSRSDRRAVH